MLAEKLMSVFDPLRTLHGRLFSGSIAIVLDPQFPFSILTKALRRLPWPIFTAWAVWLCYAVLIWAGAVEMPAMSEWQQGVLMVPMWIVMITLVASMALSLIGWLYWPFGKVIQYWKARSYTRS